MTLEYGVHGYLDEDMWWDSWIVLWALIGITQRYRYAFANQDWCL